MNLTKKITLALGLLAAGAASHAQTTAASSTGNGFLGQRFAEVNLGLQNLRNIHDHSYSTGASVNLPAVPSLLDVGATYDYSWVRGPFRGHANTVGVYAVAYTPLQGAKPFFGAAVGYQWTSLRFLGSDGEGLWGLTAGVEVPVGVWTFTPRVSFSDDIDTNTGAQDVTGALEVSRWINTTTAVFGSLSHTDVRRSSLDSWNYTVGLRLRF
jgi:hypothetical protein